MPNERDEVVVVAAAADTKFPIQRNFYKNLDEHNGYSDHFKGRI